jgi:hypothetical protein
MPAVAPPTITLAVMVRDDARRLDRCLNSMRRFVEDIVVLDTGSKDDSVVIAESHRARVQKIEWPNNFGAALNVMLGMVHTTWTLRLDSDEWFDEEPARELRAMVKDDTSCGFRLIRRDLNVSGSYSEISLNRLWRTHEKIRYTGAVHESIPMSCFEDAWPTRHWVTSDIYFWHDGYATDLTAKTQRNIDLLRHELETTPGRIEAEAMLATTLQTSGVKEGMERLEALMDKVVEEDRERPGPQVALAIAMYLGVMPAPQVKTDRTAKLIERALTWYPKNPPILYYCAILEKERGNLETALNYLLKLEARAELGDYDRSMSIPQEFLGEKLWNALGFIATQLNRRDVAQRCNRHMLMLRSQRRPG